jgi:hypothetical protein
MHEQLRLGLEALEEQVLLSFVAGRFLPCEPMSSTYPVAFPKSHKSYQNANIGEILLGEFTLNIF